LDQETNFLHLTARKAVYEVVMVASVATLSEAVDLTTIDRKLADAIQDRLPQIKAEIEKDGSSIVVVDGKTFRITMNPQD
jgi:hypothetical protein